MNYHIDTGLIWENFKKEGECPLCDLYEIVNARVVEQFTTEAVMEDHARDRVNCLADEYQAAAYPQASDAAEQACTGQARGRAACQGAVYLRALRSE